MNTDRHYLEKGVTEVNSIGGPPISAQDLIPLTKKERLTNHWKRHHVKYRMTAGWTIPCVGLVLLVWILIQSIQFDQRQAERNSIALVSIVATQRVLKAQHIRENIRLNKIERAQRDSDIAFIRHMEDEQAPLYAKIMDEEMKAEGAYNKIGWESMSVRFPPSPPAFNIVERHLEKHGWLDSDAVGFSPRGYLFQYYYKFPKTKYLQSETMTCSIHGHVGMPLAHRCVF